MLAKQEMLRRDMRTGENIYAVLRYQWIGMCQGGWVGNALLMKTMLCSNHVFFVYCMCRIVTDAGLQHGGLGGG